MSADSPSGLPSSFDVFASAPACDECNRIVRDPAAYNDAWGICQACYWEVVL